MQKIDIRINKAVIEGYSIQLKDDEPIVRATIGLYAGSKKISDFTIMTDAWNDESKFELPFEIIEPIVKIGKKLEKIVTNRCNDVLALLPAPKGVFHA